jgi:TRAP-type C4-dicarboxylate transport system substrate-binding protein
MNKDFYYKASEADRQLFHAAAQEFVKTDVSENKTYYDVAMAAGRKLGVEFYVVPEADKQGFRDKLAPFFTSFQSKFTKEELNAFFDAVKRTAP